MNCFPSTMTGVRRLIARCRCLALPRLLVGLPGIATALGSKVILMVVTVNCGNVNDGKVSICNLASLISRAGEKNVCM